MSNKYYPINRFNSFNTKKLLLFILLVSPLFKINVKAEIKRIIICDFETVGVAGRGNYTAFWHSSNKQGLSSIKKDNGYMHLSTLVSSYSQKGFKVDYGIDLGIGANLKTSCFLHQLYLDAYYKWLGIEIGMKERWSDKNHSLSSGSLTWSGNSRPIPEVRIGIPNYVRIPILGSWFSLKGHIAYGR